MFYVTMWMILSARDLYFNCVVLDKHGSATLEQLYFRYFFTFLISTLNPIHTKALRKQVCPQDACRSFVHSMRHDILHKALQIKLSIYLKYRILA